MSRRAKIILAVIGLVIALVVARRVFAQDAMVVPRMTHGPVVSVLDIRNTPEKKWHTNLLQGAGWKFGVNVCRGETMPIVSLEFPTLLSADSEEDAFALRCGVGVGFFGNFMLGATYDAINVRGGGFQDTGLLTGNNSRHNIRLMAGVTAAFGNPNGSWISLARSR